MKMKLLYISILLSGIIFTSCKKDNTTPASTNKTFMVIATSSKNWVYFSFAKGDTIQVSRPDTSTAWDIAFQKVNMKTNSGLSGKGIGGADNSGKIGTSGFSQLITVSDTSKFLADDSVMVQDDRGNNIRIIGNSVLTTPIWYNYNLSTNVLTSKGIVYIIKTATGKYAKFLITNFYNPKDPSITGEDYYTFTYFYQPNGSKTLQ
jgi:hypothetical protein